ncbi:unannotated protein [freshwater metagenome]|uniref:Unannotated protein n=1 Tax=freshwater metagenome TaxID=449393 RepID=A0A6J7D0X4_9ZZZZ|nr:NAD-dependent epimerase/dehydratase family protein [Actinomycetota bacterium]
MTKKLKFWFRRHLPVVHFASDAAAWAVALVVSAFLRLEFSFHHVGPRSMIIVIEVAIAAQGLIGLFGGLYRRRWRYGSFDEVLGLTATDAVVGLLTTLVLLLPALEVPRSVAMLATPLALLFGLGIRAAWRLRRARMTRPSASSAEAMLILGAGDGAEQVLRMLLHSAENPYIPVALLDDDPNKQHLRVHGVRVVGTLADTDAAARRFGATTLLLAIPTANSDLIRRVDEIATAAKLRLLVLPPVFGMLGTPVLDDLRPVSDADLLGRNPSDIDTDAVANYINGKRVLVTGAGGSIGSELCRQLARLNPAKLVMLDRDENGLHRVQLSMHGHALLDSPDLALADLRDHQRIRDLFELHRPQVVFHAAALKHLPLLEAAPSEAWKTNVVGTHNVLEAAQAVGVERLVNISTDKAADPASVLGYAKRVTERLTSFAGKQSDGTFVSVRFGNVLASNGSVLTSFRSQAAAGGPLTVTHRDVTRYFMTVEEAVRLTIYAAAIGRSGEVLILDMGSPVRIADLAERLAVQHNPRLEVVYTGLRPGEKLHEDLIAANEADNRPVHPLITHVEVPALSFAVASSLAAPADTVTAEIMRVVAAHDASANATAEPSSV